MSRRNPPKASEAKKPAAPAPAATVSDEYKKLYEEQLHASRKLKEETEKKVAEAEKKAARVDELERKLTEADKRSAELSKKAAKVDELERKLAEAEKKAAEAEKRATDAEKKVADLAAKATKAVVPTRSNVDMSMLGAKGQEEVLSQLDVVLDASRRIKVQSELATERGDMLRRLFG